VSWPTRTEPLAKARLAKLPSISASVVPESPFTALIRSSFQPESRHGDNDAYNALVLTDFDRNCGRSHVFQIGRIRRKGRQRLTSRLADVANKNSSAFSSAGKNCFRLPSMLPASD